MSYICLRFNFQDPNYEIKYKLKPQYHIGKDQSIVFIRTQQGNYWKRCARYCVHRTLVVRAHNVPKSIIVSQSLLFYAPQIVFNFLITLLLETILARLIFY